MKASRGLLLLSSLLWRPARCADNGLALTPQLGWNTWNTFGCAVSEELLLTQADLIVSLGLRDLGYEYVVLDDCWSAGRSNGSAGGTLVASSAKFPRGMAAVADDMHARGLKFGMYSDAGRYTCGQYEGSLDHEAVDAATFAAWGVDYLKYDNCYNQGRAGTQLLSFQRYEAMSRALNATGRHILYSLCNWGEDSPWNWASTIANSWRISGDVYDAFDRPDDRCPCDGPDAYNCVLPGFHCSIMNIINKAAFIPSKAQIGAWNDLDMLTVGIGGMTDAEYVTHFSMWSAAKSPLLMGADFTKITPSSLSILANAAVLAVNQDPLGHSAARRWYRVTNDTDEYGKASEQMWSGDLNGTSGATTAAGKHVNDAVVVLINGNNSTATLEAALSDVFVDSGGAGTAPQVGMAWEVRDLWAGRIGDAQMRGVIEAANGTGVANRTGYYNATETPYAKGLAEGSELLLGKVTTTVQPSGTITATIDRHGAAMFRLRAVPTGGLRKRTEL